MPKFMFDKTFLGIILLNNYMHVYGIMYSTMLSVQEKYDYDMIIIFSSMLLFMRNFIILLKNIKKTSISLYYISVI